MNTKTVYCYGAEILQPHVKQNQSTHLAFMIKYGNLLDGIYFDEYALKAIKKTASIFFPPPVTPPPLKELSLLKIMSNFESGEAFDAYLQDDGNESQVVQNVYDELVTKSKELPIIAPITEQKDVERKLATESSSEICSCLSQTKRVDFGMLEE